jgi:hypothetical protein
MYSVLVVVYVPGDEEWVVELVEDVDDEVVVGDGLYRRPRELPVDQDPLLLDAERGDVAVGDRPREEPVRVVAGDEEGGRGEEEEESSGDDIACCHWFARERFLTSCGNGDQSARGSS